MYSQLLKRVKEDNEDYYNVLIDHKLDIIARVKSKGQKTTATELGMSQTTLSNHLKLLNALAVRESYIIYYVTFEEGYSKIGISKSISNRLTKFSKCDTIETWRMSEPLAKEAEALIKAKYKESNFKNTYGFNLPREVMSLCPELWSCDREAFKGLVLTKSDRAYLSTLTKES